MDDILYELADMKILKRGDQYFVRYDAGAHMVVMREDEISKKEAVEGSRGKEEALRLLNIVQKNLIEAGKYPYVSNL